MNKIEIKPRLEVNFILIELQIVVQTTEKDFYILYIILSGGELFAVNCPVPTNTSAENPVLTHKTPTRCVVGYRRIHHLPQCQDDHLSG